MPVVRNDPGADDSAPAHTERRCRTTPDRRCPADGVEAHGTGVGAYVVPSTGELLSAALANGGTFLGAIGFLIGAALLIPEASRRRHPASR